MTAGFVVACDGGRSIELPGWSMLVKVGADATRGALTVIHGRMDPGHAGPAEHVHEGHDETFLVMQGALRVRLDDRYEVVEPGGTVFCPRAHAHGFSNPFAVPVLYVVMLSPQGYETYFERVADEFARTGQLPDPATKPSGWPTWARDGYRPCELVLSYGILFRRTLSAGFAAISPHDIRRSYAGDLLDAGADRPSRMRG